MSPTGYMTNNDPKAVRPVPRHTGLVCQQCREPVATVERTLSGLLMECPGCGHRWSWSQTKPH